MPESTIISGIVIPSTSPWFLSIVTFHVSVAMICVVTGLTAMLSRKGPGQHPSVGSIYYWFLSLVFTSTTVLSALRWEHNKVLFALGLASFAVATLGRSAMRHRRPRWLRLHIAGMGSSYILLLIAFYVDNGKNLPLWRDLPSITYWLVPLSIGAPLVIWALLYHPLVASRAASVASPR